MGSPKVAFVTVGDTGRKTGGYIYNARVISGLRHRGFEVEEIVACGASPDEQLAAAPRLGSTFDPSEFDAIVVDALARIAVAPHIDSWRVSRPVVALIHELPSVAGGESGPETVARERDYEESLLRADRLVAVSEHGRALLESRGAPPARIHVVPPGFDRVSVDDGSHTGGDGPVRALCVAQWIPRKGILTLVEAWAHRERPGAVLELVGETDADPAYEDRVRATLATASDPSIIVSGPVDDVRLGTAYVSASLFVLPSRYEGYGMAYAEALAHGLPVIACDVGPVPEVVGEKAALLVPPGDVEALSGALDLLLKDTGLRDRMSTAARRRARRLPCWEDTTAGFLPVLREASTKRLLRKNQKPPDTHQRR